MSFQATVSDELRGRGGGGESLSDNTKVGVPYRAAKHDRRNSAAVTSATSCNHADKQAYPRLSVVVLVLDEYWAEVVYAHIRETRNLGDSRAM